MYIILIAGDGGLQMNIQELQTKTKHFDNGNRITSFLGQYDYK